MVYKSDSNHGEASKIEVKHVFIFSLVVQTPVNRSHGTKKLGEDVFGYDRWKRYVGTGGSYPCRGVNLC